MLLTPFASLASVLSLVNFSYAVYNGAAKTNVAMYWGQGPNQQRLSHFCQQTTVDVIPIGFMNFFPAQGNGWPGTNFGNQCSGTVYKGPGSNPANDHLLNSCPYMTQDIIECQQKYGKKILLSLGGASNTYQLTGAAAGQSFGDFLWGAFGPKLSTWTGPRPFDGPNGAEVQVDGFDFDIEIKPTADNGAGYIAMIQRLRSKFSSGKKQYLITGAPQCVVPDGNMGTMIQKAQFDILFIQYYNTAQCSARNWVTANPNYARTKTEASSGFSYNAWTNFLSGTASANAKLYIGLPGSTGAVQTSSFYIDPTSAANLIRAYYCKPNFGGIMIWEATYAEGNKVAPGTFYQAMKQNLLNSSKDTTLSCVPKKARRHLESIAM